MERVVIKQVEQSISVKNIEDKIYVEQRETRIVIKNVEQVKVFQDGGNWVTGETPAGAVNGSNATFTTAFDFVPESVEVFIETCRLSLLDDYNTSGTRTIQFYVSPLAGEKIRVNYQRQ